MEKVVNRYREQSYKVIPNIVEGMKGVEIEKIV